VETAGSAPTTCCSASSTIEPSLPFWVYRLTRAARPLIPSTAKPWSPSAWPRHGRRLRSQCDAFLLVRPYGLFSRIDFR
jgi:hypothetical protein